MNRLRPFLRLLQRWRLVLLLLAVAIAVLLLTQYFFGQQTGKVAPLSAEDAAALEAMEQAAGSEDFTAHEAKALCFPFDPNTADSLTLLRQGLRPWQVSNMLRYRRAGGRWRKTEDLRRLYGLDSAQYQDIAPYVRIAPDTAYLARRRADSLRRDTMPRYVSLKRDTTIELNSADTTDLKKLRGIGSWTARSIVRYREQLGGYHSAEQLREVPHIQQQMLDTTMQHLWADPTEVKTIAVNTASVQRLQRHPYIRFEQARAIYELRRRKIRLNGPEDLKGLPELSEEDIKRIAPYLNFE